MKRTRPTTSDGSRKKQRSSELENTVETAPKICTDEEYAICLKVLSQVNAATTEQMIHSKTTLEIFLNKIQTTAPHYAMNLTTRLSNASQLVASPFWNGTTTNSEIIAVLKSNRDDAFHYDAETSRLDLVLEVWEHEIIPYLNVKELAVLRPTCRWCDEQWQEFLKRDTFRVPEQVPTIDEAMRIGFNLSKQKVFSKEKPLVVVLSEGEHVVEGSFTNPNGYVDENTLDITCSNISFIGQGKDKTTVHGGFGVWKKKNVTVKSLTLTRKERKLQWK